MGILSHTEPCPSCRSKGADRKGNNLAMYKDGSGWCFACHYYVPPTLEGRFQEYVSKTPPGVPTDLQREVPDHARKWIEQYQLPWNYWQESCRYAPSEDRLVILGDGWAAGRYVGKQDGHRKWMSYGTPHAAAELVGDLGEETLAVVLTEDVISAHKVAFLNPVVAIPLHGSSVGSSILAALKHISLPVVLWLDRDMLPTVLKKAQALHSATGLPTFWITTQDDPKSCSFTTIKKELDKAITVMV